jgi:cytoskeletal protein CcmA (bactofilin family)
MWGNKKPDSDVPQAAVPAAPRAAETNPIKPVPKSLEGTAMSTDAIRPLASTAAGSTARLGASLHVKGEISGNEDLHVDGSVEGLIQLEDRKLTVGASAKLTADVVAREVVVYGSVKGNLRARDRIEIKKDGSVVGDLTTARIMIEDGAYFKGSIEIDRNASEGGADLDKPAYARASSNAPHAAHSSANASPNKTS